MARCEKGSPSGVLLVDEDSEIESATKEKRTESLFDVEVMET